MFKKILIAWGLTNLKKEVWDGHIEIDNGKIWDLINLDYQSIKPFYPGVSSWKSTTYLSPEVILLKADGDKNSIIKVNTKKLIFSFTLNELNTKKNLFFDTGGKNNYKSMGNSRLSFLLDTLNLQPEGNIMVSDVSECQFYMRTGKGRGEVAPGRAFIRPGIAKMEETGSWELVFEVGRGGLPVGGGLYINCHHSDLWGFPQFDNPQAINYVTAKTTGRGKLKLSLRNPERVVLFYRHSRVLELYVDVLDAPLQERDKVIIIIGDTSQGSPGFQGPLTNTTYTEFRVEVCMDPQGSPLPKYTAISKMPGVKAIATNPNSLVFHVPSQISPNSPFEGNLIAEDDFGNPAANISGELKIYTDKDSPLKEKITFDTGDKGFCKIKDLSVSNPGRYQLKLMNKSNGLKGVSNPFYCRKGNKDKINVYWGDLHIHTFLDDGYATPDENYAYCRNYAGLDFAALTDHDVGLGDTPDYNTGQMWKETNSAAEKWNSEGEFITFPGYEWSPWRYSISCREIRGDYNVYYAEEGKRILPAADKDSCLLSKLNNLLQPETGKVMVIPHAGSPYLSLKDYDPRLHRLLELCSQWGSYEWYAMWALENGQKPGFSGGGDVHCGFPGGGMPANDGHTRGGLTAVLAGDLTREAVWDALYRRRTYATTGAKILLDFKINNSLMGEEIKSKGYPAIKIVACGVRPVYRIDVIKNGTELYTYHHPVKSSNKITILWKERLNRYGYEGFRWGGEKVDWICQIDVHNGRLVNAGYLSSKTNHHCENPRIKILSHKGNSLYLSAVTVGEINGIQLEIENLTEKTIIDFYCRETGKLSFRNNSGIEEKSLSDNREVIIIWGRPVGGCIELNFEDSSFPSRGEDYYYVRVTQIDGEMAWSSPIWVS